MLLYSPLNRTSAPLFLFFLLLASIRAEAEETSTSPDSTLREITGTLASLPSLIPSEQTHGQIGLYGVPQDPNAIVIDLGHEATPDEVILFPARLPTLVAGVDGSNGFPPGLEVEIADEETFSRPIRLGHWVEASSESGTTLPFLRIPGNGASGRYLKVSVFGSRVRSTGRGNFFTLGEIVVLEKGTNTALHRPVTPTDSIENAPRWQASNLTDGYLWCLPLQGRTESASNGYHSLIEKAGTTPPKWVKVDLGEEYPIDEIHLIAAHPRDFADTAGFGFPPRFRVTGRSASGTEVVLFDSGAAPFPNPGAAAVMIPGNGALIRHLRVEANELWQRTADYIFALAELQVWSGGVNVALGKPVTTADSTVTGLWSPAALTDGYSSRTQLLSWTEWLDAISERERLQKRADELSVLIEREREQSIRRWLVGAGLVSFLVALGAVLIVLRQRRHSAREQEALKARIAGDLHDELGASLSHIALQSDLARDRIAANDPVAARLASLSEAARETLDHMRDMVWLLAPVAGTWGDLESRLAAITTRLLDGVGHKFVVEGDHPSGSPAIESAREIVLFLKESLTNAQKHAAPDRIEVSLIWSARILTLKIEDDGKGFDPASPSRGRGLLNYETRARALNGTVKIDTAPGKGTSVTLDIPLS